MSPTQALPVPSQEAESEAVTCPEEALLVAGAAEAEAEATGVELLEGVTGVGAW